MYRLTPNQSTIPNLVRFIACWFCLSLSGCGSSDFGEAKLKEITPQDLAYLLEAGPVPLILDTRDAEAYRQSRIPGARNIDPDSTELANRFARYKTQQIVLYGKTGFKSVAAGRKLAEAGYQEVYHLIGDFPSWVEEGHPTERN